MHVTQTHIMLYYYYYYGPYGPNRVRSGSGLVLRCLGPGFTVLDLGLAIISIILNLFGQGLDHINLGPQVKTTADLL